MKFKAKLIGLFLLSLASAIAQDRTLDLSGQWKFHPGDDLRWAAPNFDDSDWAMIAVPKAWREAGYPNLSGFGWYRTVVHLPVGATAIYFARVYDSYEVYVSGTQIGSAGRAGELGDQVQRNRIWTIPGTAIPPDRRVTVAVRVWMAPNLGGITEEVLAGPPAVLERAKVSQRNAELVASWPFIALGVVNLVAAVFFLSLFFTDRSSREYLWFGCFCFGFTAGAIVNFASVAKGEPVFHPAMARGFFTFSQIMFVQFYWTFLGLRPGWWARTLQVVAVLAALLAHLGYSPRGNPFYLLGVCTLAWLAVSRFSRLRQDEAAVLIAGFTLPTLSVASFLFPATWALDGIISWTQWFVNMLFSILMMLVLVRRFGRTRLEETRMRGELEAARAMQRLMASPVAVPGFEIRAEYHPASEVGGDFYQILPADSGSLLVVVGDVSGKGLKAAMLVSSLVGALRNEDSRQPGEVLRRLNRSLGQLGGAFVTCCCVRLDPDGAALVANAGHLSPYLDGVEVETEAGLPLGLDADAAYAQTAVNLPAGSTLTFLSDGVVEAENSRRELFGFDRTREISGRSAADIAAAAKAWGQNDDITVVTVRRTA